MSTSHPAAADTAQTGKDLVFLELCWWRLNRRYGLRESQRERVCVIG
jgi:hypothetical protein